MNFHLDKKTHVRADKQLTNSPMLALTVDTEHRMESWFLTPSQPRRWRQDDLGNGKMVTEDRMPVNVDRVKTKRLGQEHDKL